MRDEAFPQSARFGDKEREYLDEALRQNTLFYHKGVMTQRVCEQFCSLIDCEYAVTASSGTAAIHAALAAAGVGLGDEVITTSLTDMGTVIGILYQNAVPVFCDNLPDTYGMDPESLDKAITPRTKAVIVVHLAGNPCDMDSIMAVAKRHKLIVIEDCAQAWGCRYNGRYVGTIGHVGCFSTNDFKHITTGEGGIISTNDRDLFRRAHLFVDKGYRRSGDVGNRDPQQLCCNYRWSELQAAVSLAQLERVEGIAKIRHGLGQLLTRLIGDSTVISPHAVTPGGYCSFWFYLIRLKNGTGIDRDYFTRCVQAEGIPAGGAYIAKPLYRMTVFEDEAFFINGWPAKKLGLTDIHYRDVRCPTTEEIIRTSVYLPIHECFTEREIQDTATALQKVSNALYDSPQS